MANVFIAPKIKVGFQTRSDTFTGKLAYVIYYDEKGNLRKQKSWEGWRDKKIDPQEFDNVPTDGFTLNKDIKRYNGEWFSSSRTMIRVHDPRGFEFEVTTENLIGILMHTDCLRRGLIGQFVYAWVGPELVLLPTNSEEYQNSVKYTAGLSKKVSAKDLVPGISYKTKREGDVIYIGKFNWYYYSSKNYGPCTGLRKEEKTHVFTRDEGKTFFEKSSMEFLAEANSTAPVSNYAELVAKFNKKSYANKIARYEFCPVPLNTNIEKDSCGHSTYLSRESYFMETDSPGIFTECNVEIHTKWVYNNPTNHQSGERIFDGYTYNTYHYGRPYPGIRQADGEMMVVQPAQEDERRSRYYYYNQPVYTEEQMKAKKFYDFYVVFENGTRRKIETLYELVNSDD
jgi:hypothetical protein